MDICLLIKLRNSRRVSVIQISVERDMTCLFCIPIPLQREQHNSLHDPNPRQRNHKYPWGNNRGRISERSLTSVMLISDQTLFLIRQMLPRPCVLLARLRSHTQQPKLPHSWFCIHSREGKRTTLQLLLCILGPAFQEYRFGSLRRVTLYYRSLRILTPGSTAIDYCVVNLAYLLSM